VIIVAEKAIIAVISMVNLKAFIKEAFISGE
jgi:hypothetical protein